MNISRVRKFFQKTWNFSMLTSYNKDLSTATYSLQQESLNSDNMLLYVTSEIIPELEGSLIEADGQKWIVAVAMKEVVNENLYEYRLYPVTDTLELISMVTQENAIGENITAEGEITTLHCYVDDYSLKERTVPTAQPVESYQQAFLIAFNELPDYRGIYILKYNGVPYKIDSFEKNVGLLKIRATENL